MLFTQLTFLLFFAFVVLGNVLTRPSHRANSLFLLGVSWLFFAYWSIADFLIFLSILLLNYPILRALDRSSNDKTRRWLTVSSLVISLGTLAAFKYGGFFNANLAKVLKLAGIAWHSGPLSLAIPLAISFYTFHIISLVMDVQDRKYRAPTFMNYALYVSFFPHIIAGPIVRGDEILPAFEKHPRNRVIDYTQGFYLFVLGYFFKTVVGDQLADIINPFWTSDGIERLAAGDAWCVAVMYSCQIFADFAGYSWMAMGIAKTLGFDFPENFRAPYIAMSFRTFWHRWHVTLSRFLSDYLYIKALGGNRRGAGGTYTNLLLTMLLGGLWHGPAWNFVAWGGLHGGGLAVERWLDMSGKTPRRLPVRIAWFFLVQFTVLIAWVLFRAPTLKLAVKFLGQMFLDGNLSVTHPALLAALLLTLPVWLHHCYYAMPPLQRLERFAPARGLMTGGLVYAIAVMPHVPQGFIYFVF